MRLSVKKPEKLLALKKKLEKAAPLIKKWDAILEKVEAITKLLPGAAGSRVARRRGRKPGRPQMGAKRCRPAKKARKMSAAAKKRVALAVSRAQKARWAAYRKVQKAKAKSATKARKPARKVNQAAPKPWTLSAKILKVAGSGSEQA